MIISCSFPDRTIGGAKRGDEGGDLDAPDVAARRWRRHVELQTQVQLVKAQGHIDEQSEEREEEILDHMCGCAAVLSCSRSDDKQVSSEWIKKSQNTICLKQFRPCMVSMH